MERFEPKATGAGGSDNPWDHLRYANFVKDLERMKPEDLLEMTKRLAYDHFVVAPAMKRLVIGLAAQRPGVPEGLVSGGCPEAREA